MMAPVSLKPVHSDIEILEASAVAHMAWRQHYPSILTHDQIEYMLETMQDPGPIKTQIREGYDYYLVKRGSPSIGYVALKLNDPEPGRMFLSKFYLLADSRGKGNGRRVLELVEDLARQQRQESIWLTVNKRNPSIAIYERLGFATTAEQVTDIGNGYVMDDYVMTRPVRA